MVGNTFAVCPDKGREVTIAHKVEPAFTENARTVLDERYLLPGESPSDLIERVSWGNSEYYDMMAALDFLPNSPTLFNGGTDNGTLSACFHFVIPDDMNGIMDVARKAALVLKYGGGVGYCFSNLRARGTEVRTTHKVASGPVGFMPLFNAVAESITQGGKRRGAQMAILSCDHDDIDEFIHAKDSEAKAQALATFNISVAATDDWMNRYTGAAKDDDNKLWQMARAAWKTGDPGCYFIDTSERTNPTPWLGKLLGTNPCFTGDTKVWTLFGPMRFDELAGQNVQVLTQRDDGQLVFREMTDIRMTRRQVPVFRVTTRATGKYKKLGEFRATADHPVFMADGTQRLVGDLQPTDRLSSVYRYKANSKGYLKLKNTAGDEDMEHRIVAAWETDERPDYPAYHVDHIDENKTNNVPSNLRILPHADHNALNGSRNPGVRFPDRNPFNQPGFAAGENNGMYGKQHSQATKDKISATKRAANHVVVSVEAAGYADVYDGAVDETHRFFILTEDNGGVLVHNCGEVPLLNDEPCNLGSINLGHMVRFDAKVALVGGNDDAGVGWVDYAKLERTVRLATRYLDDVLDHNQFPDPAITAAALLTRKLGLGVMGWADMLALLHIDYDTDEAIELAKVVSLQINRWAMQESVALARDKGNGPWYEGAPASLKADMTAPPRNATRTCQAPTGTISILAGASSGIEPHFALEWVRSVGHGKYTLNERVPVLDRCAPFVPKTAMAIDPIWHIRMQAAWQANTDLATSKTINMPKTATPEEIFDAYEAAWRLGCKGVTIYRDGSREGQVLTSPQPTDAVVADFIALDPITHQHGRKRLPDERPAITHKFNIAGTEGYLTVGLYPDTGLPGELFIVLSKEGSATRGLLDSFAIMTSVALQYGVPIEDLTRKFVGTTFEPQGITDNPDIRMASSIMDYIFRWLERKFVLIAPAVRSAGHLCPDCGSSAVAFEEGCKKCAACGWAQC